MYECQFSFVNLAVPCFSFHLLSRSNPLAPQCHPKFHHMFITMQVCSQMSSLLIWNFISVSGIRCAFSVGFERTKKSKTSNFLQKIIKQIIQDLNIFIMTNSKWINQSISGFDLTQSFRSFISLNKSAHSLTFLLNFTSSLLNHPNTSENSKK